MDREGTDGADEDRRRVCVVGKGTAGACRASLERGGIDDRFPNDVRLHSRA
jgi:hypothetical protein